MTKQLVMIYCLSGSDDRRVLLLFFILFQFPVFEEPSEQLTPFIKIFFVDETNSLSSKSGFCEISVIGLIVSSYTEITIFCQ